MARQTRAPAPPLPPFRHLAATTTRHANHPCPRRQDRTPCPAAGQPTSYTAASCRTHISNATTLESPRGPHRRPPPPRLPHPPARHLPLPPLGIRPNDHSVASRDDHGSQTRGKRKKDRGQEEKSRPTHVPVAKECRIGRVMPNRLGVVGGGLVIAPRFKVLIAGGLACLSRRVAFGLLLWDRRRRCGRARSPRGALGSRRRGGCGGGGSNSDWRTTIPPGRGHWQRRRRLRRHRYRRRGRHRHRRRGRHRHRRRGRRYYHRRWRRHHHRRHRPAAGWAFWRHNACRAGGTLRRGELSAGRRRSHRTPRRGRVTADRGGGGCRHTPAVRTATARARAGPSVAPGHPQQGRGVPSAKPQGRVAAQKRRRGQRRGRDRG